jgi:hypothetical protein
MRISFERDALRPGNAEGNDPAMSWALIAVWSYIFSARLVRSLVVAPELIQERWC